MIDCFKYPPILINKSAMEYYKIKNSKNVIDCMIAERDYELIEKIYGENTDLNKSTPCVTVKETNYYLSFYGYKYDYFIKDAESIGKIFVVSKKDLLLMIAFMAFDKSRNINKKTKQIALRDMKLITNSLTL